MGKVVYNLSAFNSSKAAAGEMCVMVPSNFSVTPVNNTPVTIDYYTENEFGQGGNTNFLGLGICRLVKPNSYLFTVDSTTYTFNEKGFATSLNARNKKLVMGVLDTSNNVQTPTTSQPITTGDSFTVAGSRTITRSDTGASVQVNYGTTENPVTSSVTVSDLRARDHFANLAMRGMLEHIPDPSSLSNNEISMYCQAAYKWAANMMREAANARATGYGNQDESTSEVPVADLSDNTEKLLFDIKTALQRTDKAPYWHYEGSDTTITTTTVVGDHTNAVAATLPHGVHATYTSVAEAEADGWVWNDYSESVTIKNDAEHPLYISGGGGGGSSFDGKIQNATQGATKIPLEINVDSMTPMSELTDAFGYDPSAQPDAITQSSRLEDITDALGTIANAITTSTTHKFVYSDAFDPFAEELPYIDRIVMFTSNENITSFPYRVTFQNFASLIAPSLDSRYALTIIERGGSQATLGFPNPMETGKYYLVNAFETPAITCVLPEIPANTTRPLLIMACIQTPSLNTTLSVSSSDNKSIRYRGAAITLENSSRYEMDFVYNGSCWIVGATKIVDN